MRIKALRSLTIFTFSLFAFLLTVWVFALVRAQNSDGGNRTIAYSQQTSTLRQKAEQGDTQEDVREGHSNKEYGDLRWLAKHSDVIVFGKVFQQESYFSTDNEIQTRYQVELIRVIKDGTPDSISLWQSLGKQVPAPVRTPLLLYRFGGSVKVNGHTASQRLKGSELLGPGNTYVLFLQWTGSNYHLAGGMSGAVFVDMNLVTRPLGVRERTELQKYNGLDLETFIQHILTAPEG
jgi:hypothetical protein